MALQVDGLVRFVTDHYVVIDLLPAHFSGEASEDSRRLVEKYFERDPELARLA